MDDTPNAHSEKFVYSSHPLAVTLCKVVVDGYNVNALARECIEVCGKRCDLSFTLARFHFGDPALVDNDTTDELNVVVACSEHSRRRLANCRKRIGKDIVERFAFFKSSLQNVRLLTQLVVAHHAVFIRKRFYLIGDRLYLL